MPATTGEKINQGGSLLGDVFSYINAGRGAKAISNANIAAEHGVLDATKGGQQGIADALNTGRTDLTGARDTAIGNVNDATGTANKGLSDMLGTQTENLNPYLSAGHLGVKDLMDYVGSKPTFKFNYDDYKNSDAYNFQLKQGQDAIQNRSSAMGLGSSGAALKELTNFGQGLASTYYNDAFSRAHQTFQTNQNTTLANLSKLIDTGEFGTNQFNGASENAGNQIAKNTTNAGLFAGGANLSVGELLAKHGLQGAESSGWMGQHGADLAGKYAVGAGEAHAAGINGQGTAVNQGLKDLIKALTMGMA